MSIEGDDLAKLLRTPPEEGERMNGIGYVATIFQLYKHQVLFALATRGLPIEESGNLAESILQATIEEISKVQPTNITEALLKVDFNNPDKRY